MSNVNTFLREKLPAVSAKNMLIAPNIVEKKLNNAVKSFGYVGSVAHVVALFDNTLFGGGKDGLPFTGEQLIYRAAFTDPVVIPYASITAVKHVVDFTGSKKDKQVETVEISLQSGSAVVLKDLLECSYVELAKVLQSATQTFDEYKEEKQFVAISDMSEALKVAYVKIMVNMAYANDGEIDKQEFAEILMLMTRLDLTTDSRFALRVYMASAEGLASVESLVTLIDAESPDGQLRSIHISLVKDLINVHLSTGGTGIDGFAFFQE